MKKVILLIMLILTSVMIYQSCMGENKNRQKEEVPMNIEIIESVRNNDYNRTKKLIEEGADVNSKDENESSLLMIAVYNNNYEITKLLIEKKADINIQDNKKNNPFLYAGAEGQLKILKILNDAGADTSLTNRYGGVALIPASERGHVETVKYLLENTDINVNHINNLGWTALLEAVILGSGKEKYIQIVKLLLEHGADPDIADRNGVTPLDHARVKNYKEIEKLLIENKNKRIRTRRI